MRRAHRSLFMAGIWLLGGLLVAFIVLPLVRLGSETAPSALVTASREPDIRGAIVLSVKDAAITALVAALGGVPLAYVLARYRFRGSLFLQSVVDLPLAIPHTVVGIALLLVFGRRGWIGQPVGHLGVAFFGSEWGIVAAMLFVSSPFMVDTVRATIEGIDERYEKVARSLGATPFYAFRRVTFPLALRGVFAGLVLTYARSLSEFGAVALIAYYPMTAPVKVYDLYLQSGLSESVSAAVLLLLVTLSTFLVFRTLAYGQFVGRPGREP
jgi:molybdate/tungstate transport system permease protein